MKLIDTYKHKGLRKQLIETLHKKGIASQNVLSVMSEIPRHFFLDDAFVEHSYQDKAFPIGNGQTISHPSTVAYQTSLLNLKPTDIVLEIGTGSGYQTLVLAKLCKFVLTIERQKDLYKKNLTFLPNFNQKNIKLFYGDGYKGLPNYAPFDKIIVTCGAQEIPEKLVSQLRPNGRMIVPIGNGNSQKMIILDKDENQQISQSIGNEFKFVPMLKGKA